MSDSEPPSAPETPRPESGTPATPSTPGLLDGTPPASDATPSTPGGSENGEPRKGPSQLHQQFKAFAKFGDPKSDGTAITLSQSDKWMKQAKVIDGKSVTTTDTGIAFKKFKQQKIHFKEFQKFLDELAASKKVEPKKMKDKLSKCGAPGTRQSNNASPGGPRTSVYDRLCDVSKYGASHRQRFDEHGKGKGIAGRKDIKPETGYVSGYKNQDTYPKNR